VAKFVRAYESADLDALVSLLTDDVFIRCRRYRWNTRAGTPWPGFCAILLGSGRTYSLVPARANGQPAFGGLRARPRWHPPRDRPVRPHLGGDRICALTRFESSVLARFACRDRSRHRPLSPP